MTEGDAPKNNDQAAGKPSTPEATAAAAQSRTAESQSVGGTRAANETGRRRNRSPLPDDSRFTFGNGIEFAAFARVYPRKRDDPVYRPLKIYTIDPSTRRLEGAAAVINVPYEELEHGPSGARFKIEKSPDSPFADFPDVDLDDKRVLIRSGREPAPSDPAFHHQMVYAVCSSIYAAFRTALGRELAWGFGGKQLRIIPHGMNDRNAQYSATEQSLKFGWYKAEENALGRLMPKGHVFACLSHDIIAHELTHALLDGLRAEFGRSVSLDTAAFHEAFADLVALLQRFSYKEVVKNDIRDGGGVVANDSALLRLATEFGQGVGLEAGIRKLDLDAEPKVYTPDSKAHELGVVLVSAVFEAFLTVYKRRSAAYFRLASNGTGVLPEGNPPADLVDLLAHLLSRLASQFLAICIRAVDYCPPVNIMFGEYLRALVTADFDLVPDDPWAYREALIEAFGRRRIYPPGVASLTKEALLWRGPSKPMKVRKLDFASLKFSGDPANPARVGELRKQAAALGEFVTRLEHLGEFGLAPNGHEELRGDTVEKPRVESVRSSRRVGPDGQIIFDMIAEITQCRNVQRPGEPLFQFYGGSTVVLDPSGDIRYIIRKSVLDNGQLEAQHQYWMDNAFETHNLQHCLLARERPAATAGKASAQ
jgi:hypothetical protein